VEFHHTFGRTFLCLASAWQGLQAYPVAGTQAVIATVLPVLVYSLCLYEAVTAFAGAPWMVERVRALTSHATALTEMLVITVLLYLFAAEWCNPLAAWRYYASVPKLGLPGAGHLRLPAEQVNIYQDVTQYLKAESDTFTTISLNSFYFWTGKTPPTYFNIAEVSLLNEAQQDQVIAALRKARRPLIVLNTDASYDSAGHGPLRELIEHECHEVKRFGNFRILELADVRKR
jgi:hypothetical protein